MRGAETAAERPDSSRRADPGERLGIDDVFEVRVLGETDLSGAYRIAADGTIDYPFIGRISVIGMRSGDVQELIATKLADGYIKKPQVSLMVKEWNSRKVSVMGQVQHPGSVSYFTNMTIVDAIAGGRWLYRHRLEELGDPAPRSQGAVQSMATRRRHQRRPAPDVVLLPGDI